MFSLAGHGINRDVVIASAWVNHKALDFRADYREIIEKEVESELGLFQEAVTLLESDFKEIAKSFVISDKTDFNNLLNSQRLILNDPLLINGTKSLIKKSLINAECALVQQMNFIGEEFSKISNPYFKERKHDVEQIVKQVIQKLTSLRSDKNSNHVNSETLIYGENVIFISNDLSINEIPRLVKNGVCAFAIESGSPTSHLAIVLKSFEIPAIIGLQKSCHLIKHGEKLILDSECGNLIVGADNYVIKEYEKKIEHSKKRKNKLNDFIELPCETEDGIEIKLMANIEDPREAKKALGIGASGIGLFRTEFLFMEKESLPSEEEQFAAYKNVLVTLSPNPVVIRTLDLGGDKLSPLLSTSFEEDSNPALGQRGIRFSLENTDLFITQIRAIIRASRYGNAKILLPLITEKAEIIKAKALIDTCKKELENESGKRYDAIDIGAMIEVPSAALSIETLIPHVDFASLGTNDLIQYTLAIDRTNNKVSNLFNPKNPGVVFLIKNVIDHCLRANLPISVCGEISSDVEQIKFLLNLGLREISTNVSDILIIKEHISKIKIG